MSSAASMFGPLDLSAGHPPGNPHFVPLKEALRRVNSRVNPYEFIWSDEEVAILLAARTPAQAVENYHWVYGRRRSAGAIESRWYKVAARAGIPLPGLALDWEGDEDHALLMAGTPAKAVRAYQALFGKTRRTATAIRSRYQRLRRREKRRQAAVRRATDAA